MVFLRYFDPKATAGDGADDYEWTSRAEDSAKKCALKSRFHDRRPRPIQYPGSAASVLEKINKTCGEPTAAMLTEWSEDLKKALSLSADLRDEVCRSTCL